MKLPSEIRAAALTALIDTREQNPLTLPGLATQPATLATGDYSLRGLEHQVAIERKSLPDFVACCGRERDRFDREVKRLLAYPVRALVIEAEWQDIEQANWRGKLTSKQVGVSIISWMVQGLPVVMAGNHDRAGRIVAAMIIRAATHRYREIRSLLATTYEQGSELIGETADSMS
jgi:ERCC4-type nuclease